MAKRRFASWLELASIAVFVLIWAGCPKNDQSNTQTPPAPTPTPTGQTLPITCPVITDPDPTCPGVAFTEAKLTCNGAITAALDSAHPHRIGVTVPNGSTVTGNVRGTSAIGGPCHGIGAKFAVVINLGAQYTGDYGPNAPICMARSKLAFTQFDVGGSIFNSAWNPTIQALIHDQVQQKIDQAVVDNLNASPGSPARCANFVELP